MTDQTLADFLDLNDADRQRAAARALENAPELKGAKAVPAPLRAAAADAAIWTAKNVLTDPVSHVIGGAWGKLRELQKFAADEKIHELTLHEHEIALSRNPSIEIVINGSPTGLSIPFELKIGLIVESAVLKVQNKRIIAATIGKVKGAGSFSCAKTTIAERKTSEVRLPGALTFSPGIAVG